MLDATALPAAQRHGAHDERAGVQRGPSCLEGRRPDGMHAFERRLSGPHAPHHRDASGHLTHRLLVQVCADQFTLRRLGRILDPFGQARTVFRVNGDGHPDLITANYVGGSVTAEGAVEAFGIILSDPKVKGILVNIFGGITRCDEVARGILAALEQMKIELPIVVRLDGTNAEEGRKILADAAPPNLYVEPTMLEAAQRAVELAA